MKKYKSTIYSIVLSAYPSHPWRPWKFTRPPPKWFETLREKVLLNDKEAVSLLREFVDQVGQKLGVKSLEDWYSISAEQARPYLRHRLESLSSLPLLLPKVHPEHEWDLKRFNSKSAGSVTPFTAISQLTLTKTVDTLIPNQNASTTS